MEPKTRPVVNGEGRAIDRYRVARVVFVDGEPIRFESSWTNYEQACRVLRVLIDLGDNAKIESWNGGSR